MLRLGGVDAERGGEHGEVLDGGCGAEVGAGADRLDDLEEGDQLGGGARDAGVVVAAGRLGDRGAAELRDGGGDRVDVGGLVGGEVAEVAEGAAGEHVEAERGGVGVGLEQFEGQRVVEDLQVAVERPGGAAGGPGAGEAAGGSGEAGCKK